MENHFEGKSALVTGAAAGIGREIALALAGMGASVVVADIETNGAHETARMIEKAGGKAIYFKTDVADAKQVEKLIQNCVEAYGRIDFAINNAGVEASVALTADCSEAEWDRVIGINLKGVWLCMKFELAHMVSQKSGVIVNISSIAGLTGLQYSSAYVASKHGVNGITKVAAIEYALDNIRINAVCPGFIDTRLMSNLKSQVPKEFVEAIIGLTPMNRMGTPKEVADTVLYLCSDKASFITGHTLTVDGGFTAH